MVAINNPNSLIHLYIFTIYKFNFLLQLFVININSSFHYVMSHSDIFVSQILKMSTWMRSSENYALWRDDVMGTLLPLRRQIRNELEDLTVEELMLETTQTLEKLMEV